MYLISCPYFPTSNGNQVTNVLYKNSCSWRKEVKLRSCQLLNQWWKISLILQRFSGNWSMTFHSLDIAISKLLAEACRRDWCQQKPLAHTLRAIIHLSEGQCSILLNISTSNKIEYLLCKIQPKQNFYINNTPRQQQCVQWKFDWHPSSWLPKSINKHHWNTDLVLCVVHKSLSKWQCQ